MSFEIRVAKREDSKKILEFINMLAVYEKMQDQVVATVEKIESEIFDKKSAEVLFAVEDGKEVGFALYFKNFSTFLGKSGIYLEDLFVMPEYRNKGYGKALLKRLAKIAVESGAGRFEWCCLDWNKPSIEFYERLKATRLNEWLIFRLTGAELENLAKE